MNRFVEPATSMILFLSLTKAKFEREQAAAASKAPEHKVGLQTWLTWLWKRLWPCEVVRSDDY